MRLDFFSLGGGRCRTVVHRGDGVSLVLRSYSRRHRVPHDLAHAVTERELGLRGGVFGCIAAGAVFSSMRVVSGTPRHDAAARSARVIKDHARLISLAEVLSGVLHHAVETGSAELLLPHGREAWGSVDERPFPYTAATLAQVAETLTALADRFTALGPDEALGFEWPGELAARVPAGRR